jgi:cell volume regulation protein A
MGVPALLLFIAIGMLAGSDGPGGIYFNSPKIAQSLGVVALALILFAGGLETRWDKVRPVFWQGLSLSTLGTLLTAVLVGTFVTWALDLSFTQGLLMGAIVSATDAAAVFSVLRSSKVSLRSNLKPLLELESGSNDPMAVLLTLGMIRILTEPFASAADLAGFFVLQIVVGATVGYVVGKAGVKILNAIRLEYEGFYTSLTLALALLSYSGAAVLGGNGFLAAYASGLVFGNSAFDHKKSVIRFHDGLSWLMQIAMFLVLGLLVFPSRMLGVSATGLAVALFLILCARPLSVFASLCLSRLNLREKLMV